MDQSIYMTRLIQGAIFGIGDREIVVFDAKK
jgi:hypothetical protein